MTEDLIILKRKQNLGQLFKPTPYMYQQSIDYGSEGAEIENPDGTIDEFDPKRDNLLGTTSNLTPHWDKENRRWAFEGSIIDLQNIQKELKLRDKNDKLIVIDEDSFTNRLDPFFNHKHLWTSVVMRDGKIPLTNKTKLEEFYQRVYKGRDDIEQNGKDQSTFETDRSNLELISPKAIKEKSSKDIDMALKANMYLAEMNFDKQKRIAAILDPPGYNEKHNDPEAIKIMLYDSCVINSEQEIDQKTIQKRFVELAEMNNSDLEVLFIVFQAKNTGKIRRLNGVYHFDGEALGEGDDKVKTMDHLIKYFLKGKNFDTYKKVEDYVSTL